MGFVKFVTGAAFLGVIPPLLPDAAELFMEESPPALEAERVQLRLELMNERKLVPRMCY